MKLKSVIHYPDTNSVEATWVEVITPESTDAEGNVTPAVERQVRCHSYADVQMDMLEADLGADAASFTLANMRHYGAYQATIGAGSTVTNQSGFYSDSGLTGATNNYGFHSNIASGANRYNFYAAGTADNYFAGQVYTSSTLISVASTTAHVNTAIPAGGTAGAGFKLSSTANFGVFFGSGAPTLSAAKGSLYLRSDGSATNNRMYVNTDGATTWTAVTTAA